jgi:hypothetical protein
VNENGFVGLGTTTNSSSLARMVLDNSISSSGASTAIAGQYGMYTFNPSSGGVQVGNRFVVQNNPTGTANTAVGGIMRMVDSTALSNLVRGFDITANGGSNTSGVNTGVRASGHTFGLQGITTGLAGGSSIPAAIYGENTGTTQGDILRLYTSTMTTASSVALFYQESSSFSGNGLTMDFGRGGGSFSGKFLNLKVNNASRFVVTSGGDTTIGQTGQTSVQAGLQVGYGGICVDNDGSCTASTTGRITAVQYNTANADLAESYHSNQILEAGDIVYSSGGYSVARANSSEDPIIGVVSTRPGITLGDGEYSLPSPGLHAYPIGLSGRVPVKLSDQNGPVEIGDSIILSSVPGVGMKATSEDLRAGATVVGIALEAFDVS